MPSFKWLLCLNQGFAKRVIQTMFSWDAKRILFCIYLESKGEKSGRIQQFVSSSAKRCLNSEGLSIHHPVFFRLNY